MAKNRKGMSISTWNVICIIVSKFKSRVCGKFIYFLVVRFYERWKSAGNIPSKPTQESRLAKLKEFTSPLGHEKVALPDKIFEQPFPQGIPHAHDKDISEELNLLAFSNKIIYLGLLCKHYLRIRNCWKAAYIAVHLWLTLSNVKFQPSVRAGNMILTIDDCNF